MSALMQAAASHLPLADPALVTHYLSAHSPAFLASDTENGGIIDWATQKNQQVQTLLIAVGATVGVLLVVIAAVASRGSLVKILLALITAGIVVWGVSSVRSMKDRVDEEINGMTSRTLQGVTAQQPTSVDADPLSQVLDPVPPPAGTGPAAPMADRGASPGAPGAPQIQGTARGHDGEVRSS